MERIYNEEEMKFNRKKYYEKLKSFGRCTNHPNRKSINGTTHCKKCLEKNIKNKQKLIKDGKCSSHPKENNPCRICRIYRKQYKKKYQKIGKCHAHHKEDLPCKICKKQEKHRKNHIKNFSPEKLIFSRSKRRAFEKNIPFDILISDIVVPERCSILSNIKINLNNKIGKDDSPSIDRIDNRKGYIKGNIQIISMKANAMKNSATPEELLLFADWIYRTYKKKR